MNPEFMRQVIDLWLLEGASEKKYVKKRCPVVAWSIDGCHVCLVLWRSAWKGSM